jgi:hypothetical protein
MDMTVYVVQNTHFKDKRDGRVKPKFDFGPATQFGPIEFLLELDASPFDLPPVQKALHAKLRNFTKRDYLLCVGSPVLIGLAVAIAAEYNNGNVGMLQWSGEKRQYFPARAFDVFDAGPGDRSI